MALSKIQNNSYEDTAVHGRRNLIINGAMQVWQRATAATDVGGNDVYKTADRWVFWENTDGAFTTEQSTDVPSGEGFAYSLKAACTTADTSLAAGQFSLIGHKIEAQNLSQLNYGTSSAKTMTISFWVKSNKTGTYCFSIEKDDETDYILIKEFSISSADTWEKKTLTITPDSNIKASAGAITNDNGIGFRLLWALALGTTYNAGSDDGTWTTSTHFGTTNQVNWMDSTSNNFYLTGVQLEVGDIATPFEHEDYGTTLHKCQRYLYRTSGGGGTNAPNHLVGGQAYNATTVGHCSVHFPAIMRAKPTFSTSGLYAWNSVTHAITSTVANNCSIEVGTVNLGVASGLTTNRGYVILTASNGVGYVEFDAEL